MKRHMKNFCRNMMTVLLSTAGAMALAVDTAPATKTGKIETKIKTETEIIRSVFILPSNPKEGRDPFFPDSERPYEIAAAANPQAGNITSLVLKGFSGPLNHRLVIINNHTFGAGDTGNVITPSGRIHLRCIAIKTNSVIIETGGQRHELIYSNKHQ
jgi:hypothetical protein